MIGMLASGRVETFLLAMTPIGELRAAIPVALTVYNLPFSQAYFIAVLGNLVPVLFLLTLLKPVTKFLRAHFRRFDQFFDWLFQRTRNKAHPKIKKYGAAALIVFVALPSPLTGAWTGSLAAFLFDISFKKAFPLIALGIMIAGIIVSIATQTGIAIK